MSDGPHGVRRQLGDADSEKANLLPDGLRARGHVEPRTGPPDG